MKSAEVTGFLNDNSKHLAMSIAEQKLDHGKIQAYEVGFLLNF